MTKEAFFAARANTSTHLYVNSVFETIDGETNLWHAGCWSVFIRLQGCRVGCKWCDTKYSWDPAKGGTRYTPEQIMHLLSFSKTRKITLTGGEPMEQWGEALTDLLYRLRQGGYRVSMETAGCDPLGVVIAYHPEVNLIVDYKMPSAQIVRPVCTKNFGLLRPTDVVKIVAALDEVESVPGLVNRLRGERNCRARIVLSPLWGSGTPLSDFVQAARRAGLPGLDVGFSIQQHKLIWPHAVRDEEEGGSGLADVRRPVCLRAPAADGYSSEDETGPDSV